MRLAIVWAVLAIATILVVVAAFVIYSGAVKQKSTVTQSTGASTSTPAFNIATQTTGARANSNVIFGVTSPDVNLTDLEAARSYGLTYVRADVSFDPGFNAFLLNATQAGYGFLGILDYDTVGAKITGQGCVANCNWTLSDWNASVANAVAEYPQIHYWEIWNEPQFPIFQDGFQNGNPYNYSLMLKSAYEIIKAKDPSDTVLCTGGDNIFVYGGNQTLYDYQWAEALWSYNASRYCDIVSLHAYSDGAPLNYTIPQTNFTVARVFSDNLDAYENLTKKPIWITETGMPSNIGAPIANGSLYQEQFLSQSFNLVLAKPYITGVFWFDMANYPYNSSKSDYGLFNGSDFSPHPAAFAFKSFAK